VNGLVNRRKWTVKDSRLFGISDWIAVGYGCDVEQQFHGSIVPHSRVLHALGDQRCEWRSPVNDNIHESNDENVRHQRSSHKLMT
jgi:hypothetical protein